MTLANQQGRVPFRLRHFAPSNSRSKALSVSHRGSSRFTISNHEAGRGRTSKKEACANNISCAGRVHGLSHTVQGIADAVRCACIALSTTSAIQDVSAQPNRPVRYSFVVLECSGAIVAAATYVYSPSFRVPLTAAHTRSCCHTLPYRFAAIEI